MIPLFTSCLSRGDKSHRSFQLENSFHEKASPPTSKILRNACYTRTHVHTYINTHIRVTHFRIVMKEEACSSSVLCVKYHDNNKKKERKKGRKKGKRNRMEENESFIDCRVEITLQLFILSPVFCARTFTYP